MLILFRVKELQKLIVSIKIRGNPWRAIDKIYKTVFFLIMDLIIEFQQFMK